MITEDMIQKAIEECEWKKDVLGADICVGMCGPCLSVINNGECHAIRELVRKDKKENDRLRESRDKEGQA